MKKLFQIIRNLPYIISAILLLYVALCIVDVNAHNLTDHAYGWWNMFLYW